MSVPSSDFKFPLREWQMASLKAWKDNDLKGCFEIATGGGKTTFALACFKEFQKQVSNGKCLVIVPTTALLDQWFVAFQDDLLIPASEIKILNSKDLKPDSLVNLVIINSARGFQGNVSNPENILLVVDECHRAGSPENSKSLIRDARGAIGLSATPHREYDEGFDKYVIPALGKILFTYTLDDAISDGVLSNLALTYVKIPLLPTELTQYESLTKRIARSFAIDPSGETSKPLLLRRSRLTNDAFYRIPTMLSVIENNRGKRALVFVESIEAARSAKSLLDDNGHSAAIYHSQMSSHLRRSNLSGFRSGLFDVLIACRALDEGFNVPEAELAIIVAGTASKRQRIQRMGRVLRSLGDKEFGEVITIYATQSEENRLVEESKRFDSNATTRWIEAIHE